jgi:uncharacterized protein
MVERMLYLNKLTQTINTDFVKLLTGVRRSGKSTLLKLFKQNLLANGVDASEIIEISFEKYEDERYKDQAALHERVKKASQKGGNLYLMIDEIQEMPEWAKTINSLHASFNIDIYLTGSNARMFSGEHLTYLAGRYLEIKVYPLSFSEYLDFKGIQKTDFKMTDFDA